MGSTERKGEVDLLLAARRLCVSIPSAHGGAHPQATGAHWDAPFDVDDGDWEAPGAHQQDARARISEG